MFAIIILVGLALRLLVSPLGFHIDILSLAGWGDWIYKHGPLNFYQNNEWIFAWPTQPPLMNLILAFDKWLYTNLLEFFRLTGNIIVKYHLAPGHMRWWFEFTKWFDTSKISTESVFSTGYLISIKILPILADLGIAATLYLIAKKVKGVSSPLIYPALYLFSPFSWYLSALWGQYDQLSFLLVLVAFLLESRKKLPLVSPLIFATSIAIKPTSLILVPLFLYIYFKNKHGIKPIIVSAVLITVLFIFTTAPFTENNVFLYSKNVLFEKIFLKAASRLSANAYNFWRVFTTTGGETAAFKIIFIPAYIWGLLAYALLHIKAVYVLKEINRQNVIKAVFLISAGGWLFMPNMLDRYFFAGVVSGLILSIYNKRLLKYWVFVSLIFFLNLFNQWWFPEFLHPVRELLTWQNGLISKILSLLNVGLFIQMARILLV